MSGPGGSTVHGSTDIGVDVSVQLKHILNTVITYSLLKLANYTAHGYETCVFEHFHDNHEQKMASGTFPHNYFFTSQTANILVCMCVFHDDHQPKNSLRHFFL